MASITDNGKLLLRQTFGVHCLFQIEVRAFEKTRIVLKVEYRGSILMNWPKYLFRCNLQVHSPIQTCIERDKCLEKRYPNMFSPSP